LFLIIAGLVFLLKEWPTSPGIFDISSGWQAMDYNGTQPRWKAFIPEEAQKEPETSLLTIRNTIPLGLPANAALFFPPYSTFQAFEVCVGKKMIYRSGKLESCFSNRHLYLKWHLIPLGFDASGKQLVIRFYSDHHRQIGLSGPAYIGKPSLLLAALVLRDMDITVLAFVMIIAGVAAMILFAANYESKNIPLALLGMLALSAGGYSITESRITQIFIGITPIFSYLHYISLFFFSMAMAAFIEKSLGPGYQNFIRKIWQALALVVVSGTVLDLFSLVTWDISFSIGMWMILVLFVPLSINLIKTALSGNYEARILCMGFGIVLLFGLIDLIVGLRMVILENQAIFPWALLFLVFSFMWVQVYTHKTERKEMEKARRSEQEAITEERHRIAREIHDGLAQDLAAMNMKAGLWKHLLNHAPHKMDKEISWFETLISKNIKDVRRCIFALRPIDLENFGFKEGLERMISEFALQHRIRTKFNPSGLAQIPGHLELVLYRITQEALNNVAKHALATDVVITLHTRSKNRIVLEIEDNGKGFLSNTSDSCYKKGHLGLKQIRERVKMEKGKFHIQTSPGNGTSLSITLPMT
jgi:signal transduction histidine kinase